jgi:DNA invertase Pin-like site-specific DNA recombinase
VDTLEELKAVGCAFVSLRDNLDLSTLAGRMMFHVIGAMAKFERELIRERVKAGFGPCTYQRAEAWPPKSQT